MQRIDYENANTRDLARLREIEDILFRFGLAYRPDLDDFETIKPFSFFRWKEALSAVLIMGIAALIGLESDVGNYVSLSGKILLILSFRDALFAQCFAATVYFQRLELMKLLVEMKGLRTKLFGAWSRASINGHILGIDVGLGNIDYYLGKQIEANLGSAKDQSQHGRNEVLIIFDAESGLDEPPLLFRSDGVEPIERFSHDALILAHITFRPFVADSNWHKTVRCNLRILVRPVDKASGTIKEYLSAYSVSPSPKELRLAIKAIQRVLQKEIRPAA